MGPALVGSLGLSCRYNRFLFCLGCSSRPSIIYFFLAVHYFISFVPIAQQTGRAAVLGRRSLSMCLCCRLEDPFTWSLCSTRYKPGGKFCQGLTNRKESFLITVATNFYCTVPVPECVSDKMNHKQFWYPVSEHFLFFKSVILLFWRNLRNEDKFVFKTVDFVRVI